jgi:type I restriction enzyme, S subunit
MIQIPTGWKSAAIGDLCVVNPRQFEEPINDYDWLSKIPMSAVGTETGVIDPVEVVQYYDVKERSLSKFQTNDVIFAKITPCMENGKVALAEGLYGGRAVGSTEFYVLRSKGSVEPKYLMYYLLQSSTRKIAERSMTGAVGQRRVPRRYLEALKIPLPSLTEQKLIVAVIEEHLTRVSAGLRMVSSVDKKIISFDESLLGRAVAGELCPQSKETSDHLIDKIRALQHERAGGRFRKHIAALHVDGYTLPRNWRTVSLADLCYSYGYGTSVKCDYEGSGVPVLRIPNICDGEINANDLKFAVDVNDSLRELFIDAGDLLFVRTNGSQNLIGRLGVVRKRADMAFASYLIRFRLASDLVASDWIRAVVHSPRWRSLIIGLSASSAGQYNINSKALASLPIPIPPRSEQEGILSALRKSRAFTDRLQTSVDETEARAANLRTAILSAAFDGRFSTLNT